MIKEEPGNQPEQGPIRAWKQDVGKYILRPMCFAESLSPQEAVDYARTVFYELEDKNEILEEERGEVVKKVYLSLNSAAAWPLVRQKIDHDPETEEQVHVFMRKILERIVKVLTLNGYEVIAAYEPTKPDRSMPWRNVVGYHHRAIKNPEKITPETSMERLPKSKYLCDERAVQLLFINPYDELEGYDMDMSNAAARIMAGRENSFPSEEILHIAPNHKGTKNLAESIRSFPIQTSIKVLRDAMYGCTIAHEGGFVFRDAKAENIHCLEDEKGVYGCLFDRELATKDKITKDSPRNSSFNMDTDYYAYDREVNRSVHPGIDTFAFGMSLLRVLMEEYLYDREYCLYEFDLNEDGLRRLSSEADVEIPERILNLIVQMLREEREKRIPLPEAIKILEEVYDLPPVITPEEEVAQATTARIKRFKALGLG